VWRERERWDRNDVPDSTSARETGRQRGSEQVTQKDEVNKAAGLKGWQNRHAGEWGAEYGNGDGEQGTEVLDKAGRAGQDDKTPGLGGKNHTPQRTKK
jgi:hypothetical protein